MPFDEVGVGDARPILLWLVQESRFAHAGAQPDLLEKGASTIRSRVNRTIRSS